MRYKRIVVDGKRILEHRYIAEKFIGRPLKENEHVHHINNNPIDNRIENLQIISPSEHSRIHHGHIGFSRKHKHCIECGRSDRKHEGKGLCSICHDRKRYPKRRAYNIKRLKEYYSKNKKEMLRKMKEYYEANPELKEKKKEYLRKYFKDNKIEQREYKRKYRAKNRERLRDYFREYYRKNLSKSAIESN